MNRFEAFKNSLDGLANCPTVTRDLMESFDSAQMKKLAESSLTYTQKMAIEAELIRSPGAGTLEIIAHSLIGSPHVPDLGIVLSDLLRQELAEEADYAGEGLYQASELLKLPDHELARSYLNAIIAYTQSQVE
jgi:hypothetical protein